VAVAELFHIEIRPNTEERNIAMNDARAFAEDWIAAWNAHDLDRILSHYAPEVACLSPVAQKRVGNGRVEGLAALRGYWSGALAAQPGLKFELIDVLAGHACLTHFLRKTGIHFSGKCSRRRTLPPARNHPAADGSGLPHRRR
jgi:ketosteroid isomerase-like protein